ncbi:hypothetical protein N1851_009770 [Merluccius polli]|uniref:Uncharacterized protein n=1 Tax=Merluccius polli TaxID=89951 RepID=A0AA47N0K5_MERPO|nr:hypothetical protein N1851_009770 [Merluccius polli]
MWDSGSMVCSISEVAVEKIRCADVLPERQYPEEDIVLIGCGGLRIQPEGFYDLEMQLYGVPCIVPTLVVSGQQDDLILGSNIIKYVTHVLKGDGEYWDLASFHDHRSDPDIEHFLSMFTNVERWKGSAVPDKIGTVKLNQAVTLLPRHEHLVWGRLPAKSPMSPGSTVVVEQTDSKAMPRGVLVGRLVTPLWGDRWVPMTVVNPSDKAVTLKRNCKLSHQSQTARLENHSLPRTGYGTAEVRALCQAHCAWNDAAGSRALYLTQNILQLSSGRDALPMFSAQELQLAQERDPVISKVLPFVSARKRPSRRERHGADSKVLRLLKQWDRLEVHDGVLYRVSRDPVSKQRRSQFVLPQSLKDKALSGIHDLAAVAQRHCWKISATAKIFT